MDESRLWALQTFGEYGPHIRARLIEMVRAEHQASAAAQQASGHRSTGVYGEFWRGILERFEEFGDLPGSTLVRPTGAPYRVPVVNGIALFPWRFADIPGTDQSAFVFTTSDARAVLTDLPPLPVQEVLDFALPDTGLEDEDIGILLALREVTRHPAVVSGRLVLVAIASSVTGLHALTWGEVILGTGGHLHWHGPTEDLLGGQPEHIEPSPDPPPAQQHRRAG